MILSKDPKSVTLVEEIFGPVITVRQVLRLRYGTCSQSRQVFVFEDADYEKTIELIDETSEYGLTGAMYVHVGYS